VAPFLMPTKKNRRACDAAAPRTPINCESANSKAKRKRQANSVRRTYYITDGNIAVGRIEQHGNKFTAYDSGRQLVGTFDNVLAAVKAVPPIRGRA
jgi:putative salt-induced outer membrane protein YdiY